MINGRSGLVTGAGGGIGRAAAIAFAKQGAKVTLADLSVEGVEQTAAMIRDSGGEAFCQQLDVADAAAVDAAVDAHVERHGSIDFAFNNAGISLEDLGTEWGDLDLFDRTQAVNTRGVLLCMRAEIRHMVRQGSGAIVNTASIAGMSGAGGAGYCASKHAVVGLTRSAALRYAAQGIRINAVCPGVIETPMTEGLLADPQTAAMLAQMSPIGRFGKPEDIANAVLFLCSEAASFITGHPLAVDGGYLAR